MNYETKSMLRNGMRLLSEAIKDMDQFEFKAAKEKMLKADMYFSSVATIEEMIELE